MNIGAHLFRDHLGTGAQAAQDINEQAVVIRQHVKDVRRLDGFAAV
jgi:hypothetical protein